jgi:hypothetical protein
MFSDTPLPPEEPAGANPPDGAILDYYLPEKAKEVIVELFDGRKNLVNRFASSDKPEHFDSLTFAHPLFWIRPTRQVSIAPGHHRLVWDLRYATPAGARRSLAISAVYGNTPTEPRGPFVQPGTYTVRLTVDGAVQEKTFEVRKDPRVTISAADLQLQFDYSMRCYRAYAVLQNIRDSVDRALKDSGYSWPKGGREQGQMLRGEGLPDHGDILYGSIRQTAPEKETLVGLQEKFLYLLTLLQSADARPTEPVITSVESLETVLKTMQGRWQQLQQHTK